MKLSIKVCISVDVAYICVGKCKSIKDMCWKSVRRVH